MSFGVYVHWPYCRRICPYCDFNVRRWRGGEDGALLDAIIADLEGHAARLGRRRAASVHFGGGTPSLLTPGAIARVLAAIDRVFGLEPEAEIGLEANPEDGEALAAFCAAGVNRLSLGVQALEGEALAALGRNHDPAGAVAAVERAAAAGARVSIDLIYARPGQTLEAWAQELRSACALPLEHLSAYQLTFEEGTPFAQRLRRGVLAAPSGGLAADFYTLTQSVTAEAGLPAYEISNHAKGAAAQSRHNLLYWRGQDWIGVGPGAHGRFVLEGVRRAAEAHRSLPAYAAAVGAAGVGWRSCEALDARAEDEELVLMGLRLAEGVDLARLRRLLNALPIAPLAQMGLVVTEQHRLRLTPAGRLVADRVAMELLGGAVR